MEKYILRIPGLDKYVIMPNHVHMILFLDNSNWGIEAHGTIWASSPTASVSQLVKTFKTLVSKEIGFSLWQRSFHDHIIRNEREYQKIWQYIDQNHLKWSQDCYYTET